MEGEEEKGRKEERKEGKAIIIASYSDESFPVR